MKMIKYILPALALTLCINSNIFGEEAIANTATEATTSKPAPKKTAGVKFLKTVRQLIASIEKSTKEQAELINQIKKALKAIRARRKKKGKPAKRTSAQPVGPGTKTPVKPEAETAIGTVVSPTEKPIVMGTEEAVSDDPGDKVAASSSQ